MTKRKSDETKESTKKSASKVVQPTNGNDKHTKSKTAEAKQAESTQAEPKVEVLNHDAILTGYATQFTHTDSVVGMIPMSYTVSTLADLVSNIEKNVTDYCNLGMTALSIDVNTPYATIKKYDALKMYEQKDDKVGAGSSIKLKTNDGTLACIVYVGDKYEFLANSNEMDEDSAMWESFKRDGGRALKDLGIFVGGQVVGNIVGKGLRLTGKLIRAGSYLYAQGDLINMAVGNLKESSNCTVYFKPLTGGVSAEQAVKYRALVDKYKGK